jgi:hypothetical protein
MQKKALHNQSLLDIAIQEDGSITTAFYWALSNAVSLTDDLLAGQELSPPQAFQTEGERNVDVADFFKAKNQIVATGFNGTIEDLIPDLGIGAMAVGTSFQIADY